MQIQVAVKVGEIGPTSRTKSALKTVASPLMKRARRSTNSGISCISARGIRTQTVRLDKTIYLILGLKTPQRDWIAISESNWQTNLDAVQANHQRRTKSGPLSLSWSHFRVEEASRAIDSPLREHPDIHVGEIDRTHWAITQARQLAGSTIEVPDNATFHQAQPIDAMRAAQLQQQGDTDAFMRTPNVSLNGSSPLRLTFNISELRELLGLPNYNFLAQGVFSDFQPPADPSEDTEDTDHQ
ncbi:hypothetical protein GQ600_15903 [Phytophthora cactorum]|nr:hypothetical protein GQ600_15903 [Phytophthora cactorum]